MTADDSIKCRCANSGMTGQVGGFQNPGVCLQAFPSFLPHPLSTLSLTPFFTRSLTLVLSSLLLNRTETLATQANKWSISSSGVCQFWKKRWRHDSIVLLKTRKNRNYNRKKQGSFFQSLFQVSSFNIRDFRASSTGEEAFSLLFECQGNFPATFR